MKKLKAIEKDLDKLKLSFEKVENGSYGLIAHIRNEGGDCIFNIYEKVIYCYDKLFPISKEVFQCCTDIQFFYEYNGMSWHES